MTVYLVTYEEWEMFVPIGIYSTREKATEAIEKWLNKYNGGDLEKKCCHITPYEIDAD